MATINIDIDIDDIIYSLGRWDREYLLRKLISDCDVAELRNVFAKLIDEEKKSIMIGLMTPGRATPGELIFNDNLNKLSANYMTLTKEEEGIIESIAKKY